MKLPANLAKNGCSHVVALPADLADHLRGYLHGRLPGVRAFPVPTDVHVVAGALRRDLAGAKVERETHEGLIDFHAFRHTAITWLLDVYELHPRMVMEIAQLSSLEFVMRYSRRFRLTDFSYVDKAPTFSITAKSGKGAERA